MVADKDEFMVGKSWASRTIHANYIMADQAAQPERQAEAVDDVFVKFSIDLREVNARPLNSIDDIINAAVDNEALLARIEYQDNGYHVCLDHPVKTFNVNEIDGIYQTDTGPLIVPDLSPKRLGRSKRFIEVFDHAFAAFNTSDWVDFVVNVPTEIGSGISVDHYSAMRRVDRTRNALYALT